MLSRTATYSAILLACIFSGVFAACSKPAPASDNSNTGKVTIPPIYEGFHDITDCNYILGWAWDKNRPNDPIQVEIYDGNTLIATITAGDFRQDLLNQGHGNGNHAFTYPVPPNLKDGKPHSIVMKFAGSGIVLSGTPKSLNCKFEQQ